MSGRQKGQRRPDAARASPQDKFAISHLGELLPLSEHIRIVSDVQTSIGTSPEAHRTRCERSLTVIKNKLLNYDVDFFRNLALVLQWMKSGPAVIDAQACDMLSAIGNISMHKCVGEQITLEEVVERLEHVFPRPVGYEVSNVRRLAGKLGILFPIAPDIVAQFAVEERRILAWGNELLREQHKAEKGPLIPSPETESP